MCRDGESTNTKGTPCTRGAEGQGQKCRLACLPRLCTGRNLHSPLPQDQMPLASLAEDNETIKSLLVLDPTTLARMSRTLVGGRLQHSRGCLQPSIYPPATAESAPAEKSASKITAKSALCSTQTFPCLADDKP